MTQFFMALMSYTKQGKNEHDDAPDALTGTIEKRPHVTDVDVADYF